MTKLFMYGTDLQELEQMMMMVPNFKPKGSGIMVLNCKDERGDFDYRGYGNIALQNCSSGKYFCLKEKRVNYLNDYSDLIKDCFKNIKNNLLKRRLHLLIKDFQGELFINDRHRERF